MLTISGFHKSLELDDFERGCVAPGGSYFIDHRISGTDLESIKSQILEFVGAEPDAMELDACEEIGRIDICRTECEDGTEPTASEIDQWRAGKKPMYYAVYTCYLQESRPVSARGNA